MTNSFYPGPADKEHSLFDYNDNADDPSAAIDLLAAVTAANHGVNPYDPIAAAANDVNATSYEYDDEVDDVNATGMTIFFLVLMVLYIGFCLYYRKTKIRRSVGDSDEETTQRQQQRRENQVVLEESISATSRARTNAEEQAKLEKRKLNIKKVLLLRLIVEDEEDGIEEKKKKCCDNSGCGECEECYWNWACESTTARESKDVCLSPKVNNVAVVASDAALNNFKRRIICAQEDEDDDEDEENHLCELKLASIKEQDSQDENNSSTEEQADQAIIDNSNDVEPDIEEQNLNLDNNKNDGVTATVSLSGAPSTPTVSPLSPPPISPCASPRAQITLPLSSPSRLSLSSPKRYTDALNCGNRRSYTDALNCAGSSTSRMNCSNHSIALPCGSIHSANICNSSSIHGNEDNSTDTAQATISFSAIISTYGEECNICLSQFQVGDRAAWSSKRDTSNISVSLPNNDGNDNDIADASGQAAVVIEAEQGNGCKHVFHDECISRWLLVRDGCPICRRSYFDNGDVNADDTTANAAAAGDEVDLELGEN